MKPESSESCAGWLYPEDPRSDYVLVDREIRLLLESSGINLHYLSDAMFHYGLERWPSDDIINMAIKEAHGSVFFLEQIGIGPIVFKTGVVLGAAKFTGDGLYLPFLVPEAICDGVPGRRLGDLVDTGIISLNERQIISARRISEGPQRPATSILFEPELVPLGSRSGRHIPPLLL